MEFKYESFEHFKNACFKAIVNNKHIDLDVIMEEDFLDVVHEIWDFSSASSNTSYFFERCLKLPVHVFYNDLKYLKTMEEFDDLIQSKHKFLVRSELNGTPTATSNRKFMVSRSFNLDTIDSLMDKYGVYFVFDTNKEIIYIGRSFRLGERLPSSVCNVFRNCIRDGCPNVRYFSYIIMGNKVDVCIYEIYFISKYKPKYNAEFTFNELPSIKIPDLAFKEPEEIQWVEGFLENWFLNRGILA